MQHSVKNVKREFAQLLPRNSHGGKRWLCKRRERDIVCSNDRDIVRYAKACPDQGTQGANRGEIVTAQNRGRQRLACKQTPHCAVATVYVVRSFEYLRSCTGLAKSCHDGLAIRRVRWP